jgi:hypothetical protein
MEMEDVEIIDMFDFSNKYNDTIINGKMNISKYISSLDFIKDLNDMMNNYIENSKSSIFLLYNELYSRINSIINKNDYDVNLDYQEEIVLELIDKINNANIDSLFKIIDKNEFYNKLINDFPNYNEIESYIKSKGDLKYEIK